MLVPLTWSVARALWRRDVGVDAIALIAMASALATGEYLAGAVVAVMLAGGNALEEYAAGRARRELTKLLERAPRIAHRRREGAVEEVPVDELRPGDIVVVRAGEVIPVDGVAVGEALVDEAALTGEPLPVSYAAESELRSGSANAGEAFDLRATRLAAESTYAAIVRLVRGAETQRAPFVRLADRYAALFLPLALAIAGLAWAASGDPVRFVAVMVVATPCPLILAAPIALIAGVSRAARRGVIVKGSGVIEQLGKARTVLFDKTGTLTLGQPALERVVAFDGIGPDELLRLAASVDQLSAHVLAEALVHAAQKRGFELAAPAHVVEGRGQGIEGRVDGRSVAVGSSVWLRERGYSGAEEAARALDTSNDLGKAKILVGVDGRLAGAIVMGDSLRDDAHEIVGRLRSVGVKHIAVVTGDRAAVAEEVGRQLGVDRVYAEQSPEGKLDVVRALREQRELTPGGHGRRRCQRRSRARARRRRHRDGRRRRHGRLRDGRRRDHARPDRRGRRGDSDRTPLAGDRTPEHDRRHGPLAGRDGVRGRRLDHAGRRCAAPGSDRRRRHRQRTARVACVNRTTASRPPSAAGRNSTSPPSASTSRRTIARPKPEAAPERTSSSRREQASAVTARGRGRPGSGAPPSSPASQPALEQLLGLVGPEHDAREADADQPVVEPERRRAERVVEERQLHDRDLEQRGERDRAPEQPVREQLVEGARAVGAGVEAVEELGEARAS